MSSSEGEEDLTSLRSSDTSLLSSADSSQISSIERPLQFGLINKPVETDKSPQTTELISVIQNSNAALTSDDIDAIFQAKFEGFLRQINASTNISLETKGEREMQITKYKSDLTEFCSSKTTTTTEFKGSFVKSGNQQLLESKLSNLLRSPKESLVLPPIANTLAFSDASKTQIAIPSQDVSGEIGDDAIARRKKPNVDLTEDELKGMFEEWLTANGISLDTIRGSKSKPTLICDVDRDMDVLKVVGIPTLNGPKSLDLLVPREKPTLGNQPTNDPASNEAFAQNYIEMLGLKAEIEQIEAGTKMHNRLSSILFRCMLSLVLGYLYNNGLDMLRDAIILGSVHPDEAKDIAFQFVQQQVDEGLIQEGNYTAIGETYDMFYNLLIKENALSSDFKKLFAPDDPDAPIEQNFETLLEMIVRLANMEPGTGKKETQYFTILQSVCFSITLILNKYELITTTAGEFVQPYWSSVVHLAAEDSTIMQRLQSIVILAVAYNSYGWLFTVMAPLALPSVVSVGSWALCSLARLPFGIIKFTGKGLLSVGKFFVGYESTESPPPIDPTSENTLIQVGWIRKKLGNIVKLIPHMVSKGDVQRLSHHIANHELEKPSLLSSIFNARGVADHDMQGPHSADDWVWYLRQTNPIGRLMGCIAEEFAELTVVEGREDDYIPTLEERLFTLVCRTLRNESGDNGFTLIPLVEMWTETLFTKLYETTDATITAVNAGFETNFKDTLLEAIVMMLSGSYVDYIIASKSSPVLGSPTSDRTFSDQSDLSSSSDYSFMSTISNQSPVSINGTDLDVSLNTDLLESDFELSGDRRSINVSLDLLRLTGGTPNLSRSSSVTSVGSSISSTGSFSSSDCHLNLKSISRQRRVRSIFKPEVDPSILLSSSSIQEDIARTKVRLEEKMRESLDISEKTETEKLEKTVGKAITFLDSLSTDNIRSSNLSGYLVADAVGKIMDGLVNLSIWLVPLDTEKNSKGGYRRRNGPILATIGRKIVNNGIYRAIKPKLIASVYGKSKRRQRKRYTKKRGLKRGRKQTTKKIHRKRRSTHKKYKRR